MKDFVRLFRSSTGDVYHITLSEDHSVLSSEANEAMHGVIVVGIELRRLAGNNATGHEVLAAIESTIADFFAKQENAIICYYCDFINPIPHTSMESMKSIISMLSIGSLTPYLLL